ncbi:MAG: S8 family serine peptidase [Anaerolineae bacterium]
MDIRSFLRRFLLPGLLSAAILAMLWGINSVVAVHAASGGAGYIVDQVVVKLNPISGATIEDINATYGTTTIRPLLGSAGIFLLQVPAGADARVVAGVMDNDLRLEFAEPNFINQVPEANPRRSGAWGGPDPAPYPAQDAAQLLELAQAHQISLGEGTLVAVLDTGVQLDHPALASSLTTTGYDFVDDDPLPEDEFTGLGSSDHPPAGEMAGHGTHVAGIVHLVAPEARIMPLRVLDRQGQGNIFSLAEAMNYAVANGADVINLSLGLPGKSDLLRDVTRQATRQGAVVVAAAGNLNSSDKQYPAAAQCALAVTSVGADGRKSPFANYGGWIAFAAPGEQIYSTFPSGGYATWSGTSMATPFVAGQAALIHSLAPAATARNVAVLIGETARSLDGLNPAFSGLLGAGQINIVDSLQRAQAGNWSDRGRGLLSTSCVRGH